MKSAYDYKGDKGPKLSGGKMGNNIFPSEAKEMKVNMDNSSCDPYSRNNGKELGEEVRRLDAYAKKNKARN